MSRRIALIVNPSAGRGRAAARLPAVEAALAARDLPFHVERTASLEHAAELARTAAGAGEIAAAMGGDGLIGAIAAALRGTDGVLGIVPGGRGNDLARVLMIPTEPAGAVGVLATGIEEPIDLAEVDGRAYTCIASCGFDSDANRIANETTIVRGNAVYLYGALRALAAWRPARFELEIDGEREVVVGYSVAIANSKAYGGGMFVAPDASLQDGLLDIVTVSQVSKLRFLRGLPAVFKGTHVHNPEVHVRRGREITVRADRPFTMYADGDPLGNLPLTVRVVPAAVRVLLPA